MATFARATFNSASYLASRPRYPATLYEGVSTYFKSHNPSASNTVVIDLGCGPGATTTPLLDHFDKVLGLDNSANMIQVARDNFTTDRVSFQLGNDANLAQVVPPESTNAITVAQAGHWFKYPEFFTTAHQVLKPNGMLAIWGYADPVFINQPAATEIFLKHMYGANHMGPYWEPGRDVLRGLFKSVHVPQQLFTDVKYLTNADPESPFQMVRNIKLSEVKAHFLTSSAYHAWKEANPDARDVADQCFDEIKQAENLTDDSEVELEYSTVLILATKH